VLPGSSRESEHSLAAWAFLENVSLSVADHVANEGEFALDRAEYFSELPVLGTPFVDVSRHKTEYRKNDDKSSYDTEHDICRSEAEPCKNDPQNPQHRICTE